MIKLLNFLDTYKYILTIFALFGIEIAPIKFSPLGWLFKLIDKAFHREIHTTLESITKQLITIQKDIDFKDIMEIKNKLCTYKALIQTGKLDEDQYRRCFELIDKYKHYQEKYGDEVNGHMEATIEIIKKSYENGD